MSKLRAAGATVGVLALLCALGGSAYGASRAGVLRPPCVVSGNSCTVRMPMTTGEDGASVVITTPRKNLGADITDNNHKPFGAMYNVDSTSTGMTFQLQGIASLYPGTVLIIVFKLVPVGSKPASHSSPSSSASASAASGSLSLSGPSSNKLGSSFAYKVSAHMSAAAEFLAFEIPGGACSAAASAYPRSSARVHQAVPVGSFTVTFDLVAEPAGPFSLCVYLVNPTTSATEVHAGAHWTNGA